MRKVWQIFVRDLRRLLKNPVAIMIAIGVAIIPSLYAWLNILANWDPYENTSTVPVAVTVEDRGADVGGLGHVNAGDMIRERLEENTQLGWTFVDDEDEARRGVASGRYFAAFSIPEDFTKRLSDVLHGDVEKARVAYYVNEKANAVAPKVTDAGSTALESHISNEFVNVVGKTVTERLKGFAGRTAAVRSSSHALGH
ncbi:YhgE/Pip domain-containing protein [Olsenella massiliensis]|uniref:YhgE/Pip domain-containing protein n=1 Tax=Olsenella massiliensis TaxID=1622075 RepID=UPI00071E0B83|nr:YhgE/Pip domain-containing protein [Olsenella massiliensis]